MLFFKFYIHTYRNGLPMTPGDGVSIQCWGTEVLLELRRSSPCQHVYSENKVDSPFIQSRSVFQKHWKDVAKSNSALGQMSGTMLNCTPPPNTGYMEVKLLWWHGWALVKLRIHSRSRHLISAYWTVQPGTKFLNLVCLTPISKETPFIHESPTNHLLQKDRAQSTEQHLPLSASHLSLSPVDHSHCLSL